jgi:small subunit ribosomal protein S8
VPNLFQRVSKRRTDSRSKEIIMVGDKIANLINGLKTASAVKKETAEVPHSKLNVAILDLLKKENYVAGHKVLEDGPKKSIEVELKYEDGKTVIHDARRVSKLSCRVYSGKKDIRLVKRGYGLAVITTSEGVMSGREACKKKIGGETLFQIW